MNWGPSDKTRTEEMLTTLYPNWAATVQESTAWCSEIGSLRSLDAPEFHASVTSENQFHCTSLYIPESRFMPVWVLGDGKNLILFFFSLALPSAWCRALLFFQAWIARPVPLRVELPCRADIHAVARPIISNKKIYASRKISPLIMDCPGRLLLTTQTPEKILSSSPAPLAVCWLGAPAYLFESNLVSSWAPPVVRS